MTLLEDDGPRTGLVVGDEVVDLCDPAVGLPDSLVDLLALGDDAGAALRGAPASAARRAWTWPPARLGAPVPRPPAFLGIARNYGDHIREMEAPSGRRARPGSPSW